jgi:hypothetical protein
MLIDISRDFHIIESTVTSSQVSLTESFGELGEVTDKNKLLGSIFH